MRWFFDTSQTETPLTHSFHGRMPETFLAARQAALQDGSPEDELSISQTADLFNVTMRTLRFYEEKGLLSPRRIGNRRFYNVGCRARLNLILKGKAMGLGLDAIAALVGAVESGAPDDIRAKNVHEMCEEQRQVLIDRRRVLDAQIEETQRTLAGLESLEA